jgi:hypothetical protein
LKKVPIGQPHLEGEDIIVGIYQLAPREIYDTYMGDQDPAQVIQESRTDLATRLRVEKGLSQDDAYYAADQILAYARDQVEAQ